MKNLELDQMENTLGGYSKDEFGALCYGASFVLGLFTLGLGFASGVACTYVLVSEK